MAAELTPNAVLTELTKFAARTDARVDQLANVSSESCQRIDNLAALSTDVCRRLVDTRGEQSLHRMALDEHGERITTLAAQLAGLQRLVESLVNERGEGRQKTAAADDESRCAVCGWPLKATIDEGCVRANCSQRPPPDRKYAPQRFALEQLRFRSARIEVDRDRLQAEADRLRRGWQKAVDLAESRRVQDQKAGDALISAITKRDELADEVERLTRERDEAKTAAQQWEAIATGPHGTARQIVEAIATWLTDDVIAIDSNVRRIIADGIRAGEWKP